MISLISQLIAGGIVVKYIYSCTHIAEVRHAVFLAIILGGVATQASTYIIIAIDFGLNIYECIKIVRKSKRGIDSKLFTVQPQYKRAPNLNTSCYSQRRHSGSCCNWTNWNTDSFDLHCNHSYGILWTQRRNPGNHQVNHLALPKCHRKWHCGICIQHCDTFWHWFFQFYT